MTQVTNEPYEVLARVRDGSVYLHCCKILKIDGVEIKEGSPEPLVGQDDPVFVEFAALFNATAVSERDKFASENAELRNELRNARDLVQALRRQIERMEAVMADYVKNGAVMDQQ